jgi:hypothetical protein
VLDVVDLHEHGVVRRGHPQAHRRERALDAAGHDRLLLAVLGTVQELLAEVVVHRGVRAASRGAGQRDGLGALAVAAHEQLRARADERGLRRAHAPAVAGREHLPERAQDAARLVVSRGVRAHLTGEHDLLELTRADPLDRPLDGLLVVRRRRCAGDARALHRVRVEERHPRRLQLPNPGDHPFHHVIDGVIRLNHGGHGHPRLVLLPDQGDLGKHEAGGRQPRPLGRRAPLVGERESAHEHGPGGRRPLGVLRGIVGEGVPAELTRRRRHDSEPPRTGRLEHRRAAEPGEHEAVPVWLLEAREPIVGPPSRKNRGTEVKLGRHGHGHGRDRGGPDPPGMPQRAVHPAPQPLLGRRIQGKARVARCGTNAHRLNRMADPRS